MILTDHVTDHTGRLLVRLVPVVAHVVHGIQAAPVHRLEAVAHVGKGPADDDRHGIVHVGALHFVFDVDGGLVDCFEHCYLMYQGFRQGTEDRGL